MRVLLIKPPSANYYGQLGANLPPLGLAYLAAVLRKNGHQVRILDMDVEKSKRLPVEGFDLVGITSDTAKFKKALTIASEVKAAGKPVVMGGYHVTFMDEEALLSGVVDYVARGEGEYILLDLVETLERDGDLTKVRGLSYRKNGHIVRNPPAPFVENLDELPFPERDLLPLKKYSSEFYRRPSTTMITSRGCPYDCVFCSVTRFAGAKWRTRSVDSIIDEITFLMRKYRYRSFLFMDDNFTLNPRRTIDFCDEVIARKLDIRWWCCSRADTIVHHPEMVKKMALAGARTVFLGLESANPEVLREYHKRLSVDQQREAVKILKHHGIRVWGSFILGDLHETKEMIKRTIRYARYLRPETCQFSVLTPYPGTRLFEYLKSKNLLLTLDWDLYDGFHAVIKHAYLTPKEIQKLLAKAYRSFYLRLSNLLNGFLNVVKYPKDLRIIVKAIISSISIVFAVKKKLKKAF